MKKILNAHNFQSMNFCMMAIFSCHVIIAGFVAEQVKTIIHHLSCVAFLVEMARIQSSALTGPTPNPLVIQ